MDPDKSTEGVYKQLLEEILMEIVFQVEIEHHLEQSIEVQLEKYIKDDKLLTNHKDIFHSGNSKETNECVCPNCGRTLGAIRFAPHLEKCVGMGRSSSRIASRRIQASSSLGKELKYVDDGGAESNGSSGGSSQLQAGNAEWLPPKNVRRTDTRRKKDRLAKNKNRRQNDSDTVMITSGSNIGIISSTSTIPSNANDGTEDIKYSTMNSEQRQHFLTHMCGVVSEHTGRLCTRSTRCPKHTDEQRNNVRLAVLSNNAMQNDFAKMSVLEDELIPQDIEIIYLENSNSNSPQKKCERSHRLKS